MHILNISLESYNSNNNNPNDDNLKMLYIDIKSDVLRNPKYVFYLSFMFYVINLLDYQ